MPTDDRYQLGSFKTWLFARLVQIAFLTLLFVARTCTKFGTQFWPIDLILVLLVFSLFDATELFAYGYGNNQGIYYQRFIRKLFMPWKNIDSVEYSRFRFCQIIVHFKRGNFFYQRIVIADNPEVRVFFAQIFRREVPSAVVWIRSHLTRSE